jgi:chromosome partitioning protein
MIDLDPQASAGLWGDKRQAAGHGDPAVFSEQPGKLDTALQVAQKQGFDIAVIDTAPNADQAALRAARSADLVLIPCRPALFDVDAILSTLEVCQLAKRPGVVVMNHAPLRSRVTQEAAGVIGKRGGEVATASSLLVVHQRVAFQHCLVDGSAAQEFEPGGAACREIEALYDWMHKRTMTHAPKVAKAR